MRTDLQTIQRDVEQLLLELGEQVQFKRPKKMAIEEMKKLKENAERG